MEEVFQPAHTIIFVVLFCMLNIQVQYGIYINFTIKESLHMSH